MAFAAVRVDGRLPCCVGRVFDHLAGGGVDRESDREGDVPILQFGEERLGRSGPVGPDHQRMDQRGRFVADAVARPVGVGELFLHLTHFRSQRATAVVPMAMVVGRTNMRGLRCAQRSTSPTGWARSTRSPCPAGTAGRGAPVSSERWRSRRCGTTWSCSVVMLDEPPATGFLAAEGDRDQIELSECNPPVDIWAGPGTMQYMLASEGLLTQMRKGVLECCVLSLLNQREMYGLELVRTLSEVDGMVLSEGTLYPLLSRLRKEDLVDTTWQESAAGPPRRYYRLTAKGRRALADSSTEWRRFRDAVDRLLDDEEERPVTTTENPLVRATSRWLTLRWRTCPWPDGGRSSTASRSTPSPRSPSWTDPTEADVRNVLDRLGAHTATRNPGTHIGLPSAV